MRRWEISHIASGEGARAAHICGCPHIVACQHIILGSAELPAAALKRVRWRTEDAGSSAGIWALGKLPAASLSRETAVLASSSVAQGIAARQSSPQQLKLQLNAHGVPVPLPFGASCRGQMRPRSAHRSPLSRVTVVLYAASLAAARH